MATGFLAILEMDCTGRRVTVAPGEALFRKGGSIRWLHLLKSGCVRLSRVLEGGTEITMARIESGELVAEASVFATRYHCDAIADVQSVLTRYRMREVLERLHDNPAAGNAYAKYLAEKLRTLRETLEIRAIRRADDRLLAWLKLRASNAPAGFDGRGLWPSIAAHIGLTGESTYRALASLERSGKISRKAGILKFGKI